MAEGPSRMTEGMLSLSWNNHSAAFTQTLATLREKEIYTDVTLACGGKLYPVHKLVLSTCSDYFLQMFERTSCKHPIIILKDVQCREMEALLSYMYAGIVCVPQSDLAQLIMVAETLQIKGLAVPDETMCTNKRLSHTWSPTDDQISPHAKRLRQDDNSTGTQYQKFSDGHTIIKPQTLTGIPSLPSFAGVVTQARGYSPTISSVGKHVQPSIRPTYTTVRYSPYPRETERQQSSPRQSQRIASDQRHDTVGGDTRRQNDIKLDKAEFLQRNGSEVVPVSQPESQSSVSVTDKDILPETLVKVEVLEGDEPVQIEDFTVDCLQPSDTDKSRGQSQSRVDLTEISKAEGFHREREGMEESLIKEEVDVFEEIKSEQDSIGSYTSTIGVDGQSSISHQSRTLRIDPLDGQGVPSRPHELSENNLPKSVADISSGWAEDSSHPLDLSDAQKQQTLYGSYSMTTTLKHEPGTEMDCLSIPVTLEKEAGVDEYGRQVLCCGFKIGGGIDQDFMKSPQGYTDNGIYCTEVHDGSAAARAGLCVHDKILQCNGYDFTMVTHKEAVDCIKKHPILNLLVARKEGMYS